MVYFYFCSELSFRPISESRNIFLWQLEFEKHIRVAATQNVSLTLFLSLGLIERPDCRIVVQSAF